MRLFASLQLLGHFHFPFISEDIGFRAGCSGGHINDSYYRPEGGRRHILSSFCVVPGKTTQTLTTHFLCFLFDEQIRCFIWNLLFFILCTYSPCIFEEFRVPISFKFSAPDIISAFRGTQTLHIRFSTESHSQGQKHLHTCRRGGT